MNQHDLSFPEIKALLTYAKVGGALLLARVLSLVSLAGFLSLAGYVAYSPNWQGAAVTLVAAFVFLVAVRAENAQARADTGAPTNG